MYKLSLTEMRVTLPFDPDALLRKIGISSIVVVSALYADCGILLFHGQRIDDGMLPGFSKTGYVYFSILWILTHFSTAPFGYGDITLLRFREK